MSTTKPKPAAAEAPKPEPPKPTVKELRDAECTQQLETLRRLASEFGDMSRTDFENMKTFWLILSRNKGCTTPIEEFIAGLVETYDWADQEGKGMTLEQVEHEMDELRGNHLADEIEQAHFMASRYPLPKAETADATA